MGGPSCTVVKQFLWFRTHKFFTKSQHPAISEDNLELARLYTKIGAWHRDVFEASILGFVVRGWGDLRSAREWYVLCVFFFGGDGGKECFPVYSFFGFWLSRLAFVFQFLSFFVGSVLGFHLIFVALHFVSWAFGLTFFVSWQHAVTVVQSKGDLM